MQTFNYDIDSAFTCCNCGKPVAIYELPFPAGNHQDYNLVQCWQANGSAMDMLWMNCLCDRYTGNQRVNPDSALSRQGLEISEYMSGKLGYPVYYHLESDYGTRAKVRELEGKQIHLCPRCGKRMKRLKFCEDYERDVCGICNLSYDAP